MILLPIGLLLVCTRRSVDRAGEEILIGLGIVELVGELIMLANIS